MDTWETPQGLRARAGLGAVCQVHTCSFCTHPHTDAGMQPVGGNLSSVSLLDCYQRAQHVNVSMQITLHLCPTYSVARLLVLPPRDGAPDVQGCTHV